MNEAQLKFRVGFVVLVAFLILAVLIVINIEGWQPSYNVVVKPPTAPGVTANTPVRKNGLLIGRVYSVETEDDHVKMVLRVYQDEAIYENETVSIGTDSFLGDSVVEILPELADNRGRLITTLEKPALTRVSIKRNPLEAVDFIFDMEEPLRETLETVNRAGEAVAKAGQGINELSTQVKDALGDDESDFKMLLSDLRKMSQKAESAFARFDRIFEGVANIVEDPEFEGEVKTTLSKLPKIFDEIRLTIEDTRKTINSFRDVSTKASAAFGNIDEFTAALKDEGPEILSNVNTSLKNVDKMIDQITSFTKSIGNLQNSDSTIAKLLNDDELYGLVLETVQNVRDVSEKLEPLVNDLRMFGDSLARDGVRQLGVKGALDRTPIGAKYKGNLPGRERVRRN